MAVKNNNPIYALKVNDDSLEQDFSESDTIIMDLTQKAGHNQNVAARGGWRDGHIQTVLSWMAGGI